LTQKIRTAFFTPLRKIPGPWYAKITHWRLKIAVVGGHRLHYIHALHERYGPLVRISPTEVAVADVESFQKIHRAGSGFNKSVWYEKLNNNPKPGIFSMRNPKEHAARRKLFARSFSKTYLRQNWESVVLEKVRLAVAKIKRDAEDDVADVLKWWTFLATDVSGTLMFGESFRMLELGEVSIRKLH
jgi:cytochrome P450